MSEVTELSLNYSEIATSKNYSPNSKIDDGLDTLLNYQVKEEKDPNVATGLYDDHKKSSSRHARYLSRRKSTVNFWVHCNEAVMSKIEKEKKKL